MQQPQHLHYTLPRQAAARQMPHLRSRQQELIQPSNTNRLQAWKHLILPISSSNSSSSRGRKMQQLNHLALQQVLLRVQVLVMSQPASSIGIENQSSFLCRVSALLAGMSCQSRWVIPLKLPLVGCSAFLGLRSHGRHAAFLSDCFSVCPIYLCKTCFQLFHLHSAFACLSCEHRLYHWSACT